MDSVDSDQTELIFRLICLLVTQSQFVSFLYAAVQFLNLYVTKPLNDVASDGLEHPGHEVVKLFSF